MQIKREQTRWRSKGKGKKKKGKTKKSNDTENTSNGYKQRVIKLQKRILDKRH